MGMVAYNMTKQFKDARARGVKFIVVDPRATETARFADVHLQIIPGQDPTLFAGVIREVLVNGWHDAEFCAAHAKQLTELRREVEPFTLDLVAERAGVQADDVAAAARLFAFESRKGCAVSGTGPNMAPHSNLAQHLIDTLNVICGRFRRAGDTVRNPGVLNPQDHLRAEVIPPTRGWASGPKSRVRGVGGMFGEMMSGTLPEEILTPGRGHIRVLFVNGGNPAVAIPDQRKTVDALKALDLLVTIEPFMTPTARLSHYILPPKLMFEREDVLMSVGYEPLFMPVPHQAFVPAAVGTPAGSQLVDEWRVYWELAKRLGCTVSLSGRALDMKDAPSTREIIDLVISGGITTVAELEASPGGKMFDLPPAIVGEGSDDPSLRFELMPDDVAQELRRVAVRPSVAAAGTYPLLLTSRRMREVMNSLGNNWAGPRERHTYNPAYLHPDELAAHDLQPGDRIEITSDHDSIEAIVAADGTLRLGVVSMSHCWGGLPDEQPDYEQVGSCTARLVSLDRDFEPINAMPRMTAIPVRIRKTSADRPLP
jgi:anaerobic selenocysteine-containing dehydrogenase